MDGTAPIALQTEAHGRTQHHEIEIEPLPKTPTSGIRRYRVCYAGTELLQSSRDPEFDSCRALLALGHTGTLTTFSKGAAAPRMRIGIERGSALRTAEGANAGPRLAAWRPFDRFNDDDAGAEVAECDLPL